VALEQDYGIVPVISAANRIPAVKLAANQEFVRPERRDKTGSRTYPGHPNGLKRRADFQLKTYMTGWTPGAGPPGYGALFQGATGGSPLAFGGGLAGAGSSGKTLVFAGAHGLSEGQAVPFGGEIRFVAQVTSDVEVELNAPFTITPSAGAAVGATLTYPLGQELTSLSLFDYWSPETAVHRVVCGAAANRMRVAVNGDFHSFEFSGPAMDVLDSASFATGEGGQAQFPAEPEAATLTHSIIPGHLGQVWFGESPDRFYTVTRLDLELVNDAELRDQEYGSLMARGISPGRRVVSADVEIFERDDEATRGLYRAARERHPVSLMVQLGEQAGQLFGIWAAALIPTVPEFDDSDTRLRWSFEGCRAQGSADDELWIAFG
jgi:hypothetical protein